MATPFEELPTSTRFSDSRNSSPSRSDDFAAWLAERPRWLSNLVPELLSTATPPAANEIPKLVELCKAEAIEAKASSCDQARSEAPTVGAAPKRVRIEALREVHGVNAIKDGAALSFGSENLAVVYGDNGAGKSGFSRILKQACGSRAKEALLPNVFKSQSPPPSATFDLSIDGVAQSVAWTLAGGPLKTLIDAHTFDSRTATLYMGSANEAMYEPRRMRLLTLMALTCDEVSRCLAAEKERLVSALVKLPADLENTRAQAFLRSLNSKTSQAEIDAGCRYGNELHAELVNITSALSVNDADARIETLSRQRTAVAALKDTVESLKVGLNDDAIAAIISAKASADRARAAATEAAQVTFGSAPLSGVGEATWRGLWEQARKYSEGHAYPGRAFPATAAGDLCVLCQQPLSHAGAERVQHFESFVRDGLEADAKAAELKHHDLLARLPRLPDPGAWVIRLGVLGIAESPAREIYRDLEARSLAIDSAGALTEVPSFAWASIEAPLATVEGAVTVQLQSLQDLSQDESRQRLKSRQHELRAQQWLNENEASIVAEVERLKKVSELDKALQLTKTNALTAKKNELAMSELTAGYQERFGRELRLLGGNRIQVEPVVEKKGKAKISFSLALKGPKAGVAAHAILSEGESRIVGLAAFLADITGIEQSTPFIFDDPISSLDHRFEERVVARLIDLAKQRQVIVFTHRLSLVSSLENAAGRLSKDAESAKTLSPVTLHVQMLHRLNGTAGIAQPLSVRERRPAKALNDLKGRVLPQLWKLHEAGDVANFTPLAQATCANLRILVESCVEHVLCNGVVQRFQRDVQTKGKIGALTKIKPSDCQMIEDLMTRYSMHEHSQPDETPPELPNLETLARDIEELSKWIAEFDKRPSPQNT